MDPNTVVVAVFVVVCLWHATNYFYNATQSGNYNLVVTDSNGCSIGAGILNVIANVDYFDKEQSLVFPNPVRDEINISMINNQSRLFNVEIYNSIGERVYSHKNENTKFNVDTKCWSSGVYLLKISTTDKSIAKKIIVFPLDFTSVSEPVFYLIGSGSPIKKRSDYCKYFVFSDIHLFYCVKSISICIYIYILQFKIIYKANTSY